MTSNTRNIKSSLFLKEKCPKTSAVFSLLTLQRGVWSRNLGTDATHDLLYQDPKLSLLVSFLLEPRSYSFVNPNHSSQEQNLKREKEKKIND